MSKNIKKVPITRMNKFFSEDEFNLETEMGREYVDGDLNMVVILYRVDKNKSTVDDVYNESYSDEIRYLSPVEINCIIKINSPDNKNYGKMGTLRYLEPGNMTLSVYQSHLDELGVEIVYGDYIVYPENESRVKYYTVANDGKIAFDNAHTNKGYKSFYRTITCVPINEKEFNGR